MVNEFNIYIYRVTEVQDKPGAIYTNSNKVELVEGVQVTEEQYHRFCSAIFKFIAVHGIKTPVDFDYDLEKHTTLVVNYGYTSFKHGYINNGKFYAMCSDNQEMLLKNMNKMVKDILEF